MTSDTVDGNDATPSPPASDATIAAPAITDPTTIEPGVAPEPAALVELVLVSVDLSPDWVSPATGRVRLADTEQGNDIDIVMARADAALVEEALAGTPPPRPRTHDLFLASVAALSGLVTGVTLTERRPDGVYVATLSMLRPDGSTAELDARPSDALNIALRSAGATLRAARSLVDGTSVQTPPQ